MFFVSKIFSFATQPLAWVALLLLTGLIGSALKRPRSLGWCWAALILMLVQGWQVLPEALLRQLESQHVGPTSTDTLPSYVGVVVLGGSLEPAYVSQDHGQPALNDAAERMTAAVTLLQHHPHLQMLFTGGEGELFAGGSTEADRAKVFFDSMDMPPRRITYESASHTTHENAVLSATLAGVNPAQPWLLLTSASHMPRAMATFKKAGWNVTPYPVDYRTGSSTPWTQYSLALGARQWHLAFHELLGLLVYRLTGRA